MSKVMRAHMSCSSSVSRVMQKYASLSGRSKHRRAIATKPVNIRWTVWRILYDLMNTMDYTLSAPTELPCGKGHRYVLSKKFEDMDNVFEIELWVFRNEFPRVASSTTGHKGIVVSSKRKWISYAMNAVQPVFKVSMEEETLEDILDSMSEADFAMGLEDIAVFENNEPVDKSNDLVEIPKPPSVVVVPDDESSQESQSTEDSQSLDY